MFHLGDCLEVLRTMSDASVDAIVTDPPSSLTAFGQPLQSNWQRRVRNPMNHRVNEIEINRGKA